MLIVNVLEAAKINDVYIDGDSIDNILRVENLRGIKVFFQA